MRVKNLCGEQGTKTLTSGESTPADFLAFAAVCEADTTFSVLTQPSETGSASAKAALLSKTYTEGSVIYGKITAATVTTGLVKFFLDDRLGDN